MDNYRGSTLKLLPIRKPVVRSAGSSHDSLGRGAEIAVSVGVFFAIGLLLDNYLETRPIFMIALSLFSVLGSFTRLWFVYENDMRAREVERRNMAKRSGS
ncbi:MAG: AtpZ/AtpI family protein [Actinobacteria bacterium]|nr:AtpZ/AtpI family protein [Actinomycetota bacterium]